MSLESTLKKQTKTTKSAVVSRTFANQFAYVLLGLVFGGFLTLSIMNDFLFFEWLSMGTFIVFALVGIHINGMNQVKRK
jgi:hypothetical protein